MYAFVEGTLNCRGCIMLVRQLFFFFFFCLVQLFLTGWRPIVFCITDHLQEHIKHIIHSRSSFELGFNARALHLGISTCNICKQGLPFLPLCCSVALSFCQPPSSSVTPWSLLVVPPCFPMKQAHLFEASGNLRHTYMHTFYGCLLESSYLY
ncbi:hypothetical protein F5Y11DRAFT_29129 [Daldinia sp. FL1419]|nr:hypothetical protein F5Y11DRAFT_29129 [Daldinia sp. FL1419]